MSPERDEDGLLFQPDEISDVYWDPVEQKPSSGTFELDPRLFDERFNELEPSTEKGG